MGALDIAQLVIAYARRCDRTCCGKMLFVQLELLVNAAILYLGGHQENPCSCLKFGGAHSDLRIFVRTDFQNHHGY